MIKPKEHNEKRSEERYGYRCAIIRENLETGMVVIGQMHNYSIGGFYFESNTILQTGDIVFLGTPDSPYRLEAPLYECHRVQIKWRKALVRSRYRFAYGVQHLDPIGIDPDFFTTRRRGLEEPLPWDHIDMGISRRYLEDEWEKARLRRHTPDCRWGECNDCGVCDFRRVRPLVGPVRQDEGAEAPAPASEQADGAWLRIDYQKAGRARYFGHLEMVSLFFRAMRRAGVPVAYSKGYHPKPRMVFDQPLPVGIESEREVFDALLAGQVDPAAMVQGINAALPEGLCVLAARLLPGKTPIPKTDRACYRVDLAGAVFDPQRLESFSAAGDRVVSHRSGKGSLKNIDLTAMVLSIELTGPSSARMTLRSEPGRMLRPEAVMDHIFGLGADEIRRSRIVKQEAAACRAPTASVGAKRRPRTDRSGQSVG